MLLLIINHRELYEQIIQSYVINKTIVYIIYRLVLCEMYVVSIHQGATDNVCSYEMMILFFLQYIGTSVMYNDIKQTPKVCCEIA